MSAALFIAGILVSGIMTVLGIVFCSVGFAFNKKSRFVWLGVFFLSVLSLCVFSAMAAKEAAEAACSFSTRFKRNMLNSLGTAGAASSVYLADSLNSTALLYVKACEPVAEQDKTPAQFYHYLGFNDYYRLPLRYPYSIHCADSLSRGALYDERGVTVFSENDNGEQDCGVEGILQYDFDRHILLAKILQYPQQDTVFLLYGFDGKKPLWLASVKELEAEARKQGFRRRLKMKDCSAWFHELSSGR